VGTYLKSFQKARMTLPLVPQGWGLPWVGLGRELKLGAGLAGGGGGRFPESRGSVLAES